MVMQERPDLIRDPVPSLLRRLAVPVGTGFFFTTMFNVVDSYFAGRISTQALAAVSLSFPLFFIIIAIGTGMLMATTSLIGHALGAGRPDDAGEFACQALSFAALHALCLLVFGALAVPGIFSLMGAQGPYQLLAITYMRVLFAGAPFFLANQVFNAILSALGDTRCFRNFLVGSFFLNLLFDPWFVYGGLGVPALGIGGIAWATVLIHGLGSCYLLRSVMATGLLSGTSWRRFIPRRAPFARLFGQGFPASLNMLTVTLGIFVITYYVSRYGQEAVAAYGLCTRIEQMVLLPVMGLNVATLTVVARNYGAGRLDRVAGALHAALRGGGFIVAIGSLAVYWGAAPLLRLFTQDRGVLVVGADYFRINAFVLGAYLVLYMNNALLQGVQTPVFSLWIGLFRQLVGPLALFSVLTTGLGLGLAGIWWGVLLVNWLAALLSYLYCRHVLRIIAADTAAPLPEDGP